MQREEAISVLSALIKRLDTQDERSTAQPWFHLLRVKRRQCVPYGWRCGETFWREKNSDCDSPVIKAETEEGARKILKDRYDLDEVGELEKYDSVEWWETVNVFLTEDGVRRHREINEHNLTERGDEVQDFMIHAFRNPEMAEVMRAIRAIVKESADESI
jgi:hypothetical protein